MDPFLQSAIEEAKKGLSEGGIPIGSVLVHEGKIIGRGHNQRVQRGSVIHHGEMNALENAGRLDDAWLIERGTMPGERVARLKDVGATDCPYFAIVLVHGQGRQLELAE